MKHGLHVSKAKPDAQLVKVKIVLEVRKKRKPRNLTEFVSDIHADARLRALERDLEEQVLLRTEALLTNSGEKCGKRQTIAWTSGIGVERPCLKEPGHEGDCYVW